jgi:hypothetical protein
MRCRTLWLLAPLLLSLVSAAPWADTAQRIRQQKQQEQKSNPTAEARQILKHKVTDVNFNNVALSDAIDNIRDRSGLNVHVNWRALEGVGITRQTAVSARMHDVPLRKLLRTIINDAGSADTITYYLDDGVVEITTREMADQQMITKVYPVADLVAEIPNFAGPNVQLSSVGQGGGGRSGGGGGGSLFSDRSSDSTTTNQQPKTKQQSAEDLVTLIKDTVKPEIWRDNGGTAAVRYFNGHIIVTAPRSVHESLGGETD